MSIHPSSFEILKNQAKTDEIVSNAKSNRGKRCYSKSNVSSETGVSVKEMKNIIIATGTLWLKAISVNYGMATEEENCQARYRDASDRYEKTNVMITLFVRTHFSDAASNIRWGHLTVHEKERMACVVEHIVLETLTRDACLPLDLAEDNWVTYHLLSIAIRNEGTRKGLGKNPTVSYFIISFFFWININRSRLRKKMLKVSQFLI